MLVLDDLHAADAPSLLLLRFLARELGLDPHARARRLPRRRPDPGQPLTETLAEVAREAVTRRLSLERVSEREVAKYVELTASEIASTGLVAAVHKGTEGNPLFVGEIVRLLSVEGAGSNPAPRLGSPSRRACATLSPAGSRTSPRSATGCWCSRP